MQACDKLCIYIMQYLKQLKFIQKIHTQKYIWKYYG